MQDLLSLSLHKFTNTSIYIYGFSESFVKMKCKLVKPYGINFVNRNEANK